jgi:co-chaperonin GroES (HSP10)
MSIIPTGHHILVAPEKLEEVDKAYAAARRAGIELIKEHTVKEQVAVSKGTVVAMGPSCYQDFKTEPWCKVGDKVGYVRHGGMFIKDPETEEDVLILNDEDIICIFKKA